MLKGNPLLLGRSVCSELACFAAANASAWPRGRQDRVAPRARMKHCKAKIVAHLRAPKPVAYLLLAPACNWPCERICKQFAAWKACKGRANNSCINAKCALSVPPR